MTAGERGAPRRGITDVAGIAVGHATDLVHLTGCTVVLCEGGAVCGGAALGGAPGTRETDLLRSENRVDRMHAALLSGGSAFGLAAADGVMRYLERRGVGYETPVARVPIVPAAVLFDLGLGSPNVRPDVNMGEDACRAAHGGVVEEGCIGAGTGASVGKLLGAAGAMKSGIGTWSVRAGGGIVVGALVATNAFGDVVDDRTGTIVAGARDPATGRFVDTAARLRAGEDPDRGGRRGGDALEHTTIGVVATDAALTKAQAARLAIAAHTGLARVVRPSHTMVDGDTFFVMGAGDREVDLLVLEAAVADVVAAAVLRSVRAAVTLGGVPGLAG
ncbi:MAG TPA: P1 family peptidase [bacterium]|nr:P1 family peptidase [bacterium]